MISVTVSGQRACTRLLISQVRALQRAHRAGITPHYGQVEQLFETVDVIERQLDVEDATTVTVICVTEGCEKPAIGGDSNYACFCLDCAGKAIVADVLVPKS